MVVDGQAVKQDVTSADKPETSQENPIYSKEQVDKLMEKVRSDAEAALGRIRKESSDAIKKATETTSARYLELIKQREDEELAAAKDEPDKVTAIRERQTRRQKETELATTREKLDEANVKLQELSTKDAETSRERTTREISERLKVDPVRLAKLAKFTDGSAEAIEEIAKELPKLNAQPRNNFRPDSNESAGGTPITKLQLQTKFAKSQITNEQYEKDMKAHGWTP